MRYPDFLREKGTIGFVAPSFGCASEPYKSAFDNGLSKFKAMGYGIDLGPNCYVEKGIGISNSPQKCGKELNESYIGVDNDVIISCGGGELMCEVIPYIDFDRIAKAKPKWYMGYSDNTNFTFMLATLCDTAAIYGPCAATFGMEPWHKSISDAMDLLTGRSSQVSNYDKWEKEKLRDEENPLLPYNTTEETVIRGYLGQKPVKEAHFQGRLLGGCMDCLVNFLGTEYDKVSGFNSRYQEDGIIWFLEACDLNVMSIRRAIWQMKHAGWFEHLKGFIIGRPLCFGEEAFGIDHYRAVTELLSEYQVPVIMDADIGHYPPMMPVVCGATAEVSFKDGELKIQYTWK